MEAHRHARLWCISALVCTSKQDGGESAQHEIGMWFTEVSRGQKNVSVFLVLYVVTAYVVTANEDFGVNPFTNGNPFLGTKLLGFSIGRGSGALKGSRVATHEHRYY